MESKTISWTGGRIEYSKSGTGPAVMLVHGFGEDNSIWDDAPDYLKGFTLLVPNLPGTGGSTMPAGPGSLETFAEGLKFILDAEMISTVIMVGHSMGGYTILAFAEKYGEMVSSLVLFHSSAFADNAEKKEARMKSIQFIQENGRDAFLKTAIPGLFYDAEISKDDIASLLEKGKRFTEEVLIHYYEAMMNRKERVEVLENFNGKVLFIIGQHDQAVPFDASMKQVVIPQLPEVRILRQTAHMGMLEEKDKAWNYLASFLSEASVK